MSTATPDEILDAAGLSSDALAGGDWPLEAVMAACRRLRELLVGIDALTREVCRDGAVQRLRAVTSSPARIVDAALRDEVDPDDRQDEPAETYGAGIVDVVRDGDALVWLVVEDGKPQLREEHMGRKPWARPNLPWPAIPTAADLKAALEAGGRPPFQELVELHLSRTILPEPRLGWASLLAAWDLGTYLLDRFPYWPILLFDGQAERGKTRAGKAVLWPAHRGMYTPSPSSATIFRDRARHRVAILLDVEDLPRMLERGSDIGDLILNSFERDGVIRRCTRPDAPPEEQVETFAAFGPTIVCTNRSVRDSSPLASRCIRIAMPEAGGRIVPDAMRPEDALLLRARCLAWAAWIEARGVELPEVDPPFRGRLRDLAIPLLRVLALVAPDHQDHVEHVLAEADRIRRQEAADSWEARVAVALWETREEQRDGRVYCNALAEYLSNGRSDGDQITPQQVGIARRNLGLRGGKGGTPPRAYIVWPGDETAEALFQRYMPTPPSPGGGGKPEGSEASEGTRAVVDVPTPSDPLPTPSKVGSKPEGRKQAGSTQDPHETYIPSDPSDPSAGSGRRGYPSPQPGPVERWAGGAGRPCSERRPARGGPMTATTPTTELDRAAHLLATLRARGLYLEPRGPDRLRIGPPDRLDEDTLAHVRALKPALLTILMDRGRRTWPCIRCENPAFIFPLPTICYWCKRTEGRPGHA